MIRMSIAERSGQPKLFTFPKDDITIGRAQGNDIILPRNNISKRHTRIFRRQGKLVVRDLDSTNGTFLNGRRTHEDEVLHAGDRIFIADFVLIVEEDESAATPVPPELKQSAPPPLPADEAEEASPDDMEELDGRETIPAEDPSEISLSPSDLETAPPDMVLADLAKAAARRTAAESSPPMPVEPPQPVRPSRLATPAPVAPVPARRTAEIPAAETPAAAPRPSRTAAPAERHAPAPLERPAPAPAKLEPFEEEPARAPTPARARGRAAAPAAEPEATPGPAPRHAPTPAPVERPAPAPAPAARPAQAARPAAKAEPAPRAAAKGGKAVAKPTTALPEHEVRDRLLARVNEVVRIKDAEPAVFGDPELQAKVKSAVLDELAILEAEDMLDPTLSRDTLVEELTGSLFGLGPLAAVAADEGIEAFVAYPDGVTFERRQGKWHRGERRLDAALLSLLVRRLAAGIPGRGRGGSAESFHGRHPDLAGVDVFAAIGGSTLAGAMVRLERTPTFPDDFDRLADAGLLSVPMATLLKMCHEARLAVAVAGPQRASRSALLRALVAGLPAEERVVWVGRPGGGGPPETKAVVVTVTPPSSGEALLEESDDAGAGLADLVQWLQPGLVVIEQADPARDVPLIRAIRGRCGAVAAGVETDRWEAATAEAPKAPAPGQQPARSPATGGVEPRLAACFDVVAEVTPLLDGSCRTLRVAERATEGGDPFALTAIFEYFVFGSTESGELTGEYRATRAVPRFLERRKARGKRVDLSLFQG
jgi:pilus assembly protein CpaF